MSLPADIVAVDLGGTSQRFGRSRHGEVIGDGFEVHSSAPLRASDGLERLAAACRDYCRRHALERPTLVFGMPGMLDPDRDRLDHCNYLRGLEGERLGARLAAATACPVTLEQDIMLQLLGEWRAGAATGASRVVGLYFGTGVGSAVLIDGDPTRPGANTLQAGHVPVPGSHRRCACGNTGCIETHASGEALRAIAERHGVPIDTLFEHASDAALSAELASVIEHQSCLIATVQTLLDPSTIVIGGGVPTMRDYPRATLVEHARQRMQQPVPAATARLVFATLGVHAPVHGAMARLAHDLDVGGPER